LRIPAWSTNPAIRVNGKKVEFAVTPGTFAALHRQWSNGDRVELELPRKLELKAVDSLHPNTVALCLGPLVLFALGADIPAVSPNQALAASRNGAVSNEWGIRVSATENMRMVPFWAVPDDSFYSPYLRLT
jgi:DUF1680 family protein